MNVLLVDLSDKTLTVLGWPVINDNEKNSELKNITSGTLINYLPHDYDHAWLSVPSFRKSNKELSQVDLDPNLSINCRVSTSISLPTVYF